MDKMLWLAQLSYCCVEYLYILYICIVFFFVFDEENNNKNIVIGANHCVLKFGVDLKVQYSSQSLITKLNSLSQTGNYIKKD